MATAPKFEHISELTSSPTPSENKDSEAFVYFNGEFVITEVTPAFVNMIGVVGYDPVGNSIFALPFLSKSEDSLLFENIKDAKLRSVKREGYFISVDNIKTEVDLSIIGFPVEPFAGGMIIIKDRTVRKTLMNVLEQREKKLKEQEKKLIKLSRVSQQLRNFVYITSHDLKTPLRTVNNFAQLLMRQYHGFIDDTGREYLSFISEGVKEMYNLVEDMTYYSELDLRPHHALDFHLPTIVYVLERMNRSELKSIGGELGVCELPNYIAADKYKIRLLLEALLSNSIKYRHPDRPLKVELCGKETKEGWELKFSDNGIGISKENFGKIFEIFKKLHHKSVYGGTGIGLALCKKIAEQHHGDIRVESVEGEGTTFIISIMRPKS